MAIDPAQMMAALSEIVSGLPVILSVMQVIVYIFLVLFFGSIAVLGLGAYSGFFKRMIVRIAFGFLSLIAAIALAGMVPLPSSLILKLMQVDMLIAGIIASAVFAVALFLVTRSLSSEGEIKKHIEKLEDKLKKERSRKKPKHVFYSPFFIAGIVIIAGLLVFSAINFSGFPSLQQEFLSAFGISQQDFESLGSTAGGAVGMPSGCYNVISALSSNSSEFVNALVDYENPQLEAKIEQGSGETVASMKRAEVGGVAAVVARTSSGKACIATENDFCICSEAGG